MSIFGERFHTFIRYASWIPVISFFIDHGFGLASVNGLSMQPTFNPDSNKLRRDVVILNRWATIAHQYSRGDVVALYSPEDPDKKLIKRIIALEGDTVFTLPPHAKRLVRIPDGYCWVEGDEKFHSKDSNTFGPVPLGLIHSKVTHIVWPLSRFGRVPNVDNADRVFVFVGDSKKASPNVPLYIVFSNSSNLSD
ncbi:3138_t:CDS:2 [Entrophospora sp. SA101]|nr:3138_t:CDS:2 [Entrophospora sp. SA101]CAJ0915893.1 7985_t:CDS:2 [Entrophospora sp. SA101]